MHILFHFKSAFVGICFVRVLFFDASLKFLAVDADLRHCNTIGKAVIAGAVMIATIG